MADTVLSTECPYCNESLDETDFHASDVLDRVRECVSNFETRPRSVRLNPGWGGGNPTISISFKDDTRGCFAGDLRRHLVSNGFDVVAVKFDPPTVMVEESD
jgi:hypothetical protein